MDAALGAHLDVDSLTQGAHRSQANSGREMHMGRVTVDGWRGSNRGEHPLEERHAVRILVERDAAAVVGNSGRPVSMERDLDAVAMPREHLVEAVAHHLEDHVADPGRTS